MGRQSFRQTSNWNCTVLDLLQPGDHAGDFCMIVALMSHEDSLGLYCVEIVMPHFGAGNRQLSKLELGTAHQMSQVRIHAEKVI